MTKFSTPQTLLKVWASGFILLVLLHVGSVNAAANDANNTQALSLVDQIILDAKELEKVQINDAINMVLSREQEVVNAVGSRELAKFYNKLSEMNATISHLPEQRQYAEKGLAVLGNETVAIAADLHYNLGLVYEINADYDTALDHYRKGLIIAQTTGNLLYQGRGSLFISAIHSVKGNYDLALATMKEAYAIYRQINDDGLGWEVFNGLSILYADMGDPKSALEFNLQALQSSQNLKLKDLTIVALNNIAVSYMRLKDYDNANLYFEKMLVESKGSAELSNMFSSYSGFAYSALESKQYETALDYSDKAAEYLPHVQQLLTKVDFYFIKAEILSKLDQPNKALEALAVAERMLPPSSRSSEDLWGLSLLRDRAKYYSELGQYEKAYQFLEEHSKGLRKFREKNDDEAERKLKVSFEVERNETRNNILEKDNEIKALQLLQAKSEWQIQTFFLIALGTLSLGLIFVMYRQFHSRRKLKFIAETDDLTGLFNRRYAFATGENLTKQGIDADNSLSVIMFDLDHFKQVNDTYGHPTGDKVLKTVGEISKGCLRGSDVMARIGGEEFIAILPGVKLEMAEFIAGRLKDKFEAYEQSHEQETFHVTASFGVAVAKTDDDFEKLIHRADKALYQAKDNGRNCVALAS